MSGVSLTLYRRHLKSCEHIADRRNGSGAMDCDCPIWVYGETSKYSYRQSLATTDLAEAALRRRNILIEDGDLDVLEPSPTGATVADCIRRFVQGHRPEVNLRTEKSYQTQLERLRKFADARGARRMTDLSVDLLEDFKIDGLPPDLTDTSRATIINKVRAFLRVAYRRGWISIDLAERMRPHSAEPDQKSPYTDEEVALILATADKMTHGRSGYASQPHTFRLLLELMLATGLRVSDAIRFDPAKLSKGDDNTGLWVYPFAQRKRQKSKRRNFIETFIPAKMVLNIQHCTWLSKALPFWYGQSNASGYSLSQQVYERMQAIGVACGISDCRPHRLRDTFAVRALLRGIPIGDVSRLLGHSSVRITEQFYAPWNNARNRRLEAIVAQALVHSAGDASGNK